MLGANVPEALIPLEVISGSLSEPYASKHRIGSAVNGPIGKQTDTRTKVKVNFTQVESQDIKNELQMMYSADFKDCGEDGCGPSLNDQNWLKRVDNSIHKYSEGHYCIALPFKEDEPKLPDNRTPALNRLGGIKRKLERDLKFRSDYVEFMTMMADKGFAEKVSEDELDVSRFERWYIVHHGVYHKQKRKLRVVFNCSLKYGGTSLNDKLLSGPDLTNNLVGVLLRFRQGAIAIMGDVEKMFYQVRVSQKDRDFLRYFWYPEGDPDQDPLEYRLKVHVFGAISSPSCANFALRQAAIDFGTGSKKEAADVIRSDFYVDDLLTSVDGEEQARELIRDVRMICASGKFNLTQMISNNRAVLDSIPLNNLTIGTQSLDFE
ncbi:uncharacterized protein LOC131879752 isoform X2 [Tigriopus californicus]|uniref:uncharacterized protein LOC131879752 isoform X2 n=1 Tax=Tigriopus californicus TaxID=6832 RepID=UPI0027DA9234|nr:uncharacterized protein LOC131879752 isoform X2 [Tigriopus californicus]